MRFHANAQTSSKALSTVLASKGFANSGGEINASSRQDILGRFAELAAIVARGDFANEVAEEVQTPAERTKLLNEAYADTSGTAWAELGSSISADITDAVARAGFLRRFLPRGDVAQGAFPRIRIHNRFTEAVVATGPTMVQTQYARDKYLTPNEFYIAVNVAVEDRELYQGSGDILQERYNEGLESILVQEDRVFLKAADVAAPILGNMQYYTGAFTPALVSQLQNEINLWSLPAVSLLMAMDLLPDLQAAGVWSTYLEPVSRLEIILTGRLGTIFGMDILTDGFRAPRLRVVANGALYCFTTPDMLGSYTDRGPVQATPRDAAQLQVPGRGWYMSELMSIGVGNAKGVSAAKRIGAFA